MLTFTHALFTLFISPSTLVTVLWAWPTTRILAGLVASCEDVEWRGEEMRWEVKGSGKERRRNQKGGDRRVGEELYEPERGMGSLSSPRQLSDSL